MFWDATNSRLGIGTNTPAFDFDLQKTVNASLYARVRNLSNGTSAFAGFVVGNDVGNAVFQVVGSGNTTPATTANQARFRSDTTITNGFNFSTGAIAPITFSTNDVERMRIFGGGNLALNSTTDSGERLQVTGTSKLAGNTAITGTLDISGTTTISGNLLASTIYSRTNQNIEISAPWADSVQVLITTITNKAQVLIVRPTANLTLTTGTHDTQRVTHTFAPTSGTGVVNALTLQQTINQTGGANGITRGLYVNPTLTAAADFRAIETARGNVVFGNLPTSSAGLPTGAIWNDAGTIKIV
jgi:hypothetical protein